MKLRGTTILAIRHKGKAAVAGDGQVTLKDTIIKHHAKKVRKIYQEKIIVGFAGATADALNLSERLERKLERYNGNYERVPFQRTFCRLRRQRKICSQIRFTNPCISSQLQRLRRNRKQAPVRQPPRSFKDKVPLQANSV